MFPIENVEPFCVAITAPILGWFVYPKSFAIYYLLDQVGRKFSAQETLAITQSSGSDAEDFPSTQTRLTKVDIEETLKWIENKNHFGDALIIHPLQYVQLLKNKEIAEAWQARSIANQKGEISVEELVAPMFFRLQLSTGIPLFFMKNEKVA
jgi:alpha-glucosidase (family GH31 glycosyl hydrolase)